MEISSRENIKVVSYLLFVTTSRQSLLRSTVLRHYMVLDSLKCE